MNDDALEQDDSARAVWKSLVRNRVGRWSTKGQSGDDAQTRIQSGFVIPEVTPSFTVQLDQPVFTIGSCLARNVEDVLAAEGVNLPTKGIALESAASQNVRPNSVLNKYNIPSILQELTWAADGPETFGDRHLLELEDTFFDPHVHDLVGLGAKEDLLSQHAAVTEVFTKIRDCKVIVMTLGMTEAWYDKDCDVYLNTAPTLVALNAAPDRFEFRVLSYEQNKACLDQCVQRIFSQAAPDAHLILTVSPVALNATFSGRDVIVANSQSKTTLVALAQATASAHPRIDYFPSYEAVMWTDPLFAWQVDRRHVSPAMVEVIIAEFLHRYAGMPKPAWPSFRDNRAQQIISELQVANKVTAKKLSAAQAPKN